MKRDRFFAFLQLLDAGEVRAMSSGKKEQEIHAMRTYARDVVAVVNFLEGSVEFVPGERAETLYLEIEF